MWCFHVRFSRTECLRNCCIVLALCFRDSRSTAAEFDGASGPVVACCIAARAAAFGSTPARVEKTMTSQTAKMMR